MSPLWPLWIRRLVCRFKGHDLHKAVKYEARTMTVGTGCVRCEVGEARRYAIAGPLPLAVKQARKD